MRQLLLFLTIVFCSSVFAQVPSAKSPASRPPSADQKEAGRTSLPSEATLDSFLKQFFGYDSSISWKILSIVPAADPSLAEVTLQMSGAGGQQPPMRLYVTPDGQHAVSGEWLPFGADPFSTARNELSRRATGPFRGPEHAAATLVEFADLECPSCKQAYPRIERLLAEEPNIRLVFQSYPLTQIHPWAMKAALWAQCVSEQGNDLFWKYASAVYGEQEKITPDNADERLTALSEQAGANRATAATCVANPQTTAKINQSLQLGQDLEVPGTPTLFIAGRMVANVNGIPYETLKKLVDFAVSQRK